MRNTWNLEIGSCVLLYTPPSYPAIALPKPPETPIELRRNTMTPIDYERLWAAVVDMPSHRDRYSVHGPDHWKRVERNGCVLTARTGAKIDVVRLFSLFHDSRRENEGWDPDHGKRGAELATAMRGTFFDLSDEDFDLLHYACVWHTDSDRHADPSIGTCWDADRLDLGRVGMIPDPAYMSTDFGAEIASHGVIQPWLHLAGAYLENPMTHHYYR